jgi:hypothetical protein
VLNGTIGYPSNYYKSFGSRAETKTSTVGGSFIYSRPEYKLLCFQLQSIVALVIRSVCAFYSRRLSEMTVEAVTRKSGLQKGQDCFGVVRMSGKEIWTQQIWEEDPK